MIDLAFSGVIRKGSLVREHHLHATVYTQTARVPGPLVWPSLRPRPSLVTLLHTSSVMPFRILSSLETFAGPEGGWTRASATIVQVPRTYSTRFAASAFTNNIALLQ